MDHRPLVDALARVIDPELGVDLVALGLVYGFDCSADRVEAHITLTSPSCPMGSWLLEEAELFLRYAAPAAREVKVALVWEPPWSPEMMSADVRAELAP